MVTKNLVFIDTRVIDYKKIVNQLPKNSEWFVLASDRDGIDQISIAAQAYSKLDSIHIFSHGADSTLYLGTSTFDQRNLEDYSSKLKTIGSSLTFSGDILLYGCELTSSSNGQAFISRIAALTSADVAASSDESGGINSANWVLEVGTGVIESAALDINGYNHTLGVINGTESNDTLSGGGEVDIIDGKGGNDSIDGGANHDSVLGGTGNDTIDGSFGNDTLVGGSGNDTLRDDQGSNLLDGGDGSDSLWSQSLTGYHILSGGAGYDNLNATGKKLNLSGGTDDDNLTASGSFYANSTTSYVQQGVATLSGGDGSDNLNANDLSAATLHGDEGDDRMAVNGVKSATLSGGDGADFLDGYFHPWSLQNMGETRGINFTLQGNTGDDTLNAHGYAYTWSTGVVSLALDGGEGNDRLLVYLDGGSVNAGTAIASATLSGGAGSDTLTGSGVLSLQMSGGAGRDTFVLTAEQYKSAQVGGVQFLIQEGTQANGWNASYETLTSQATVITDFVAGNSGDLLDIKDLLQNAAIGYDGTNPFASGYLKLEQSGLDTLFKFDADGSAASAKEWVTVAILKNVNAAELTASNFYPAFGTPNSDFLEGTPGSDLLAGIEGNDTLTSGAGNDTLDGGTGNDSLDGGIGADYLSGGTGTDILSSGEGDDTVDAGTGDDRIFSGAGDDTYLGGEGQDILFFGSDASNINMESGSASGDTEGLDNFTDMEAVDAGAGNDTVIGSAGQDFIFGGIGDDYIDGSIGNDELTGGSGSDTLNGGEGTDCAEYMSSRSDLLINLLNGTASGTDIGEDTLIGIEEACSGTGNDWIIAGNNNNQLEGGEGNDTLIGGTGTDTLIGGEGEDQVSYDQIFSAVIVDLNLGTTTGSESGSDTLESIENVVGSQAADLITGSSAENELKGGLGNDTLNGGAGDDVLYPGDGNDTANGGDGEDLIIGGDGAGDDHYDGGIGIDTVKYLSAISGIKVDLTKGAAGSVSTSSVDAAGIGNDVLVSIENVIAGDYSDLITGNAANNLLEGLQGNDTLNGGKGADTMIGGDGSDTYYVDNVGDVLKETNPTASTGGNDTVLSSIFSYTLGDNIESGRIMNSGTASMAGNILNNVIYAGTGNNILNGGDGNDLLSYANGLSKKDNSGVTVDLRLTTTQLTSGSGSDTVLNFESLEGSSMADKLTGNSLANILLGGAGNDTLAGGEGNDTLIGGSGQDNLTGGAGSDYFDFNALAEMGLTATTRDVIADFNRTEGDKIDLSTLDANQTSTKNDSFNMNLIGANANFTAAGQLKFATANGKGYLYGNTDTDADAEFVIELIGVTSLSNADIQL